MEFLKWREARESQAVMAEGKNCKTQQPWGSPTALPAEEGNKDKDLPSMVSHSDKGEAFLLWMV